MAEAARMRRSLAQLEQEFLYQREQTQREQEQLQQHAERQARKRFYARERRRGTMRFWLLALTLLMTAVLVTVGMFATLYLLLS